MSDPLKPIGRYGQTIGYNWTPRWFPSNKLQYAKDTTGWISTALLRDETLQALPADDYIKSILAALAGDSNQFSIYVKQTAPGPEEQ